VRNCVSQLIALGRLPAENAATTDQLRQFEAAVSGISVPVSSEEAVALLDIFPPSEESCFGIAWSLLHLVESCAKWPVSELGSRVPNYWTERLIERAKR
jgi:hypothetical protein